MCGVTSKFAKNYAQVDNIKKGPDRMIAIALMHQCAPEDADDEDDIESEEEVC